MAIRVTCQQCKNAVRIADKYAGRLVKCPGCRAVIQVPDTSVQAAAASPALQPKFTFKPSHQRSSPSTKSLPPGMPPLPPLEDEDDDDSPMQISRSLDQSHDANVGNYRDAEGVARGPLVVLPVKSVGISLMLTIFFGPLGLLYSTVAGGLCMLVAGVGLAVFTFCAGGLTAGVGLVVLIPVCFLFWMTCIAWGAVATNSFNAKLRQGRY